MAIFSTPLKKSPASFFRRFCGWTRANLDLDFSHHTTTRFAGQERDMSIMLMMMVHLPHSTERNPCDDLGAHDFLFGPPAGVVANIDTRLKSFDQNLLL